MNVYRVQLASWSHDGFSPPHWKERPVMREGTFCVVAEDMRDALFTVTERSEAPAILGIELVGPVWVSEEEELRDG